MTNRLASSTSPYLLQHAENPVDWYEWGEEAFAAARRLDRPVLLSVGYSACHWCHVMAHESFEDATVAAAVNASFIAVKVDREERPDIDALYMSATTALTGHGGWPMTCLLTPDGAPFFAGTYFPRQGFLQLLAAAEEAWRTNRDEVVQAGGRIVSALQQHQSRFGAAPIAAEQLGRAEFQLARGYDERQAGFGDAPKFPPSMVLEFLLRRHAATGEPRPLAMVTGTCEAMARGGLYDQLGGGFARYSVDGAWVVPHFEKMLYDNAQLLRVYTHLWRTTGSELARRVAGETADFLIRDLRTDEGGFAAALDADTDGVEGLTYVWTPAELVAVLGEADGVEAAQLFGVTETGTFEQGASTLQLPRDPEELGRFASIRQRLLAARRSRPQPARDDKVVAAWNGLAIAALADAAVAFDHDGYLSAARDCATLLLDKHLVADRLRRASRDGVVGTAAGVAEDYGDVAEGLLALHQATSDPRWLRSAGRLLDTALSHFAAPDGGFFDTADDAEVLFARPRDGSDNAAPAGQSALAGALLSYSALVGSSRHRAAADAAIAAVGELAVAEPRFAGWTLAVAEAAAAGPLQIAVVGTGPEADGLARRARSRPSPGAVVVHGVPDAAGLPLLADRPLVNGGAAAYVCRGFVCERPVTTVAELDEVLS